MFTDNIQNTDFSFLLERLLIIQTQAGGRMRIDYSWSQTLQCGHFVDNLHLPG